MIAMTEEGGRKHQLFGKSSKWSKVLNKLENTTKPTAGAAQNFNLNEDVVDFLKPSTERYSGAGTRKAPTLDVNSALRWPDAAEIRRAGGGSTQQHTVPSPIPAASGGRARRRKGLTVRFAPTIPEIIGYGGEETETPAVECSKKKQNAVRSFSDQRPPPAFDHKDDYATSPLSRPGMRERAQTHQGHSDSLDERVQVGQSPGAFQRPGLLRRAPTGMVSPEDAVDLTPDHSPDLSSLDGAFFTLHVSKQSHPAVPVETNDAHQQSSTSPNSTAEGPEQTSPQTTQKVQRRMRADEGRTFSQAYRLSLHGRPLEELSRDQISRSSMHSTQNERTSPRKSIPSVIIDSHQEALSEDIPQSQLRPGSASSRHSSDDRVINFQQNQQLPGQQYQLQAGGYVSPPESSNQPLPSPRDFARSQPSPAISRGSSPGYFNFDNGKNTLTASPNHLDPAGNHSFFQNALPSPTPSMDMHRASALDDFGSRVNQMTNVLRLVSEKEALTATPSFRQWYRCALWWFNKGRAACELLARRQTRSPSRGALMQAHVDVAKCWWILVHILETSTTTKQEASSIALLRHHLQNLAMWMDRQHIMPPEQCMIQGQNPSIWLSYPRFAPDIGYTLGTSTPSTEPAYLLPPGDSRGIFFYSRMFVNASMNTDDASTDRVDLPCTLSVIRMASHYQASIIIATQNELINITVSPEQDKTKHRGPNWSDVSWKAQSSGIFVQLAHGFTLNIRLEDHDYRALSNLIQYTQKMDKSFDKFDGERMIYEAQLEEASFTDSSNPHIFPPDKVKGCHVCVYEKTMKQNHGAFTRELYLGHRILLVTPSSSRTLSAVSLDFGEAAPFLYDIPDGQHAALQLHGGLQDQRKRMLLVFHDRLEWSGLLDILHGVRLGENEASQAKLMLRDYAVQDVEPRNGMDQTTFEVLHSLSWQAVAVVNTSQRDPLTVMSGNLRAVVQHAAGAFTDRMNLGMCQIGYIDNNVLTLHRSRRAFVASSSDKRAHRPAAESTPERHHDDTGRSPDVACHFRADE